MSGQTEYLCRPNSALGCQHVTFDLDWPMQLSALVGALVALDGPPAWFGPHGISSSAPTLHFWHCIWLQSCFWTISNFGPPRCLMSCQSTCCLSYRHVNLGLCVHLGSIAWVGACMLTNVCLTLWENEKGIFFTLIDLPPIQPGVIFWQCMAGFLPRYFFSASGCQALLTTVEAPSIYTIPRSPWD